MTAHDISCRTTQAATGTARRHSLLRRLGRFMLARGVIDKLYLFAAREQPPTIRRHLLQLYSVDFFQAQQERFAEPVHAIENLARWRENDGKLEIHLVDVPRMLRDGATGRQLLHAVTEPANLIKGVEVAHAHLLAGKTRSHVPELLHTHKRNRSVRQGRRPQPFRDGSDVLRICCWLAHWKL